jgi:hypothetical protein
MHTLALRWVSRALARVIPEEMAEALIGDLVEEHALRLCTDGPCRAALWCSGQILRSTVPLLGAALRRRAVLLALATGYVAYAFAAAAERAARDALAPVASHSAVDGIPVLFIHLCSIVLAAYAAERIGAGASLALGALVALAAVLQLAAPAHGMPLWYGGALLLAGSAAALAGRKMSRRTSRRASAPRLRKTVA